MSVPLLVVLAACTFLMAMMELVVIGFLDMLAVELGVSTGQAGLMLLTIGLLSLWVLSETEWGIYVAVAGIGAGFSTFSPALNLLLTRHDPKLATQALGLGISATNIGIAIGASVGGASLSVLEAPQLGAVGAMTVLIVLTWRFIRNPAKQMEVSS